MDNQNQQPGVQQSLQPTQQTTIRPPEPATPQSAVQPPAAPVARPVAASTPTGKPTLEVSDQAAQALLAFNNIQSPQPTKLKMHISMLVAIGLIVVLIIIASFALGSLKPKNNTNDSNSTNPATTSPNSAATNGDNDINQDVNSCKNVVNAVSEC